MTSAVPRGTLRGFGVFGLVLAVSVTPAVAQTGATTGIIGRVTDPSGGAIPGATVTVTSVDTGSERVAKSSAAGNWEVRFLSPGAYTVAFESSGFKTLRREGVTVTTAEMVTVDARLEVGAMAEAVEVNADAAMVSSSSARRSSARSTARSSRPCQPRLGTSPSSS